MEKKKTKKASKKSKTFSVPLMDDTGKVSAKITRDGHGTVATVTVEIEDSRVVVATSSEELDELIQVLTGVRRRMWPMTDASGRSRY